MNAAQHYSDLYRLGYECSKYKTNGCNGYCGNCQFNVALYCDDPREAVLIKTNAALDQQRWAQQEEESNKKKSMAGWFIIGLIIFAIFKCSGGKEEKPVVKQPATIQMQAVDIDTRPTQYIAQKPNKNKYPNEGAAIDAIPQYLRDVDNDGLINCIDYAVIFHELMPRNSRIIWNKNTSTGMNHLFNAVPNGNGLWLYIEPQATGKVLYNMKDNWGDKYNPMYNKDVTSEWEIYCRW